MEIYIKAPPPVKQVEEFDGNMITVVEKQF